ncbi:MAG TPA: glycosyltransferase [Gemmatimonadaceae bacterium]|nr:glycosyltransferase [Gemmatimonadaceae bacterium]
MDPLLVAGSGLVATPLVLAGYAYVGYPMVLAGLAAMRRGMPPLPAVDPVQWPTVTITIPVHNEERRIASCLDAVLALDYPADRRQILVISDGSTDRTEDIVRGYAGMGVELHVMRERRGKSAAENAGGGLARGDIVVNIDASVRVPPLGLRNLVRAFQDASVGAASCRDVSVGDVTAVANSGERGYVDYEMRIRALETRLGSIVGASGCFYGIRRTLFDTSFPEHLSRDFATALIAREQGYRAVSVDDALCFVPRAASLEAEYRRKIRTMARGLETLWHRRHLLNPRRHGLFALMLFSHKLARWLVYLTLPLALAGTLMIAMRSWVGVAGLAAIATVSLLGWIARSRARVRPLPKLASLAAFVVLSSAAGVLAWRNALRGQRTAIWEPTRRPA